MNTSVGRFLPNALRRTTRVVVLCLAPAWACTGAWAQTDLVPQTGPNPAQQAVPNTKRQELRSVVRQPSAPGEVKPAELHHLNAQERSQLRRQLTRELRAQNAAVAEASRP